MSQSGTSSVVEFERPLIELKGRAISDQVGRFGSRDGAEDFTSLRARLVVAVRAVCPCWLSGHREDIVQMAMMAVLRQQGKGEGKRQFPLSYLRKVAYTAMVDEIRRRRSRGEVPLENADEEHAIVEDRADPEGQAVASEIAVGVRACLEQLVSPRRTAVTLHLLGYKVPQIAEKMGWDPKRADNLVYRGMENLRECLRAKGLQP